MLTIYTLLQTDNHTNTSSLNFYRPDALPDAQSTVSKHLNIFNVVRKGAAAMRVLATNPVATLLSVFGRITRAAYFGVF